VKIKTVKILSSVRPREKQMNRVSIPGLLGTIYIYIAANRSVSASYCACWSYPGNRNAT